MRKFYTLTLLATWFLHTGCVKKWLELEPKSEVSAEVLLETPEGFAIALNGIYTNLSSSTLYGGELGYGMIEVLGRSYELKNNTPYDMLKTYDYGMVPINVTINNIWSLAYSTIANCNGLLDEMNRKSPGFFKENERALLEGELLSIRAMLHFDLLRLYAPAPVVADVAAIPYYTTLGNVPMPDKLTSEMLQSMLADLNRSKELQKPFDTEPFAKKEFNRDRFHSSQEPPFFGNIRRGFRMGYYATTALLARVALYAGNDQLAYDNAIAVINDKLSDGEPVINFTPGTLMDVGAYDRLLSEDLIFMLYRKDHEELFNNVTFLYANVTHIFGPDLNSDYRKKAYINNGRQLLKFEVDEDKDEEILSAIPVTRLSELYHIAAETLYGRDPAGALALLNALRAKRGCTIPLSPFPNKAAFVDALINDARREFVGEGKLFFLYKRLNKTILDETNGNQTLTGKFVLPVTER